LAYEGIAATILTGTYPNQHGVWTRYRSDPKRSPFKWISPFSPLLERLNGSLTSTRAKIVRYGVMRLSTLLAGITYFPGLDEVPLKQLSQLDFSIKKNLCEPSAFGTVPSLFDILRQNGLSYHCIDHELFDNDASVFKKAVNAEIRADVTMVRFVDLDTASHRYGIDSPERGRVVKQTDEFVEKIVSTWRTSVPNLSVICFADHGMVKAEGFVDLERIISSTGLKPSKEFGMFLDSTIARFWGSSDSLARIRHALSDLEYGRILSQSERDAYHIPASSSYGDVIFLVHPGYVISPNFFEKSGRVKAMHGYDPKTPGLETLLVVHSPTMRKMKHLSQLKMIDVLPTALDILGLPLPPYCQGASLVGQAHA
jgi:predicted AlkP superfamily pyrophosphatase or phosphodiesterase